MVGRVARIIEPENLLQVAATLPVMVSLVHSQSSTPDPAT